MKLKMLPKFTEGKTKRYDRPWGLKSEKIILPDARHHIAYEADGDAEQYSHKGAYSLGL